MPFHDDVTEPRMDEVPMTTDTLQQDDNPHALDAEGPAERENWLVLLAPDGTITVAPMPPHTEPEAFAAFHREVYQGIPPGVAPKGNLCMSLGNGRGSVNYHLYEGAAPSREELRKLRPLILSRWAARVHSYGETRYEEGCKLFGVSEHEPVIVRSGPAIGRELAESCVGKTISFNYRPDGMRYGDGDICNLAGFIDHAEADEHGVVASLLIISPILHRDLEDLDERGELGAARLCLHHAASAMPRKTAWRIPVFDLTHATANFLAFTSLSHAVGTCVLRRLTLDESLGPDDLRPVDLTHVPRMLAPTPTSIRFDGNAPETEPDHISATINPGAVTTPKRQLLGSTFAAFLSIPAATKVSVTGLPHNLGVIPLVTPDAGNGNYFVSPFNVTTTTFDLSVYNVAATAQGGVVTLFFM
jgi:hypothetical protein